MNKRIVTALTLLLYLGSLALPAFHLQQGDDGYYLGLVVVLFGAFSLDPRWLANPLWLGGMACLWTKRRLAALLVLASASILALLCLNYVGASIAQNASGTKTTILRMGPGYYLWLSSLLLPTASAIFSFIGRREQSQTSQTADDIAVREDVHGFKNPASRSSPFSIVSRSVANDNRT